MFMPLADDGKTKIWISPKSYFFKKVYQYEIVRITTYQ